MRIRLATFNLALTALTLSACGGNESKDGQNSLNESIRNSRGPDPIVVRIPRSGGNTRAYIYPKLDSQVWTGHGSPVSRVLSFDPEGGTLVLVDDKGIPSRVDLRFGVSSKATSTKLGSISSIDGATIYGVDSKGSVFRLTRSADWKFDPPTPARGVYPQQDGSVIVLSQRGESATLWKMRPPETKLLDTVQMNVPSDASVAQVGDRIYFSTDSGLVGVRTRDMSIVTPIPLKARATQLSPTPSGDRIYVAVGGKTGLSVIDRYTDQVVDKIDLPGHVAQLRMDPLGRYVIARPESGDSVWVIAISTNRVIGSASTKWTADLPASAPDGALVVSQGSNVVFLDGETLQAVRTVSGGTEDYWYFMYWNGFRKSATRLADHPAPPKPEDEEAAANEDYGYTDDSESTSASDQPQRTPRTDSLAAQAPAPRPPQIVPPQNPSQPPAPPQPAPAPNPVTASQLYTVSFAAMLNGEKAKELANSIIVNGVRARVIESVQAGTPIFRVILGPYTSRAMADQVGKDSKRQFWVYGGEP